MASDGRFVLRPAKRRAVKLRILVMGPSKGGKTYTSCALAAHLGVSPDKVAVIDSEPLGEGKNAESRAELYQGEWCRCSSCCGHGVRFGFNVGLLQSGSRSPDDYCAALKACALAGMELVIIDNISHEWETCMRIVDSFSARDKWTQGWGTVTPMHERFIETIMTYPGHVIATCRMKEKSGKDDEGKIQSQGMQPVQRPGIEYEFDVVLRMSEFGKCTTEGRASVLERRAYMHPGKELAEVLLRWANEGGVVDAATAEREEKVRALRRRLDAWGDAEKKAKGLEFLNEHLGDILALAQLEKRMNGQGCPDSPKASDPTTPGESLSGDSSGSSEPEGSEKETPGEQPSGGSPSPHGQELEEERPPTNEQRAELFGGTVKIPARKKQNKVATQAPEH